VTREKRAPARNSRRRRWHLSAEVVSGIIDAIWDVIDAILWWQ
jgi:hypothetical protein